MINKTVSLNVALSINEGQFDLFEHIAQEMTAVTDKESGTLVYHWFLSPDRRRCRLIETYENADALLVHFKGPAVQKLVPKLLEASVLSGFEVYGDPGPEATRMLQGMKAEIFSFSRGINR